MKGLTETKFSAENNQEFSAIRNISFTVIIGDIKLSFSRITNISSKTEYETIREGGVNDRVFTLTAAKQQPEVLVLERGISNRKIKDIDLKSGARLKKPVTIMVLDQFAGKVSKVVRAYSFDEGFVSKWETNELDAMNGEVFIERFEISHSGLKEIKV